MRIVHVYKDAYPPLVAGITRYISMVADMAAENGHDVEVIVAGVRTARRDVLDSGVVVTRVPEFGRAMSNPLSPALVRAVSRADSDVMHVHMPNPLTEIGALRQASPMVASFHAQLGRQPLIEAAYRQLQQRVLTRASSVLVSSPKMLEVPEIAPHSAKAAVLPYGVDPRLVGDGKVTKREGEPLRALFVGRLVYYKGLDVLLDSMEGLDGVRLTIIGEGPLRDELAARVESDERLRSCVDLRGVVTDAELAAAYQDHNVFVAPSVSRAESFGISMAEALCNGLPTISSALGTGTDWVNEDGVSGLVVEPKGVAALRAALVTLQNQQTWERYSVGARTLGQQRYSAGAHFDQLMKHYEAAVQ